MPLKWTVMVHLAGDNNLSSECVYALTEMKRIGSNEDVAVIAQLDSTVHEYTRLFINKGTTPGAVKEELERERDKRLALVELKNKRAQSRKGGGNREAEKDAARPSYFDSLYDFFDYSIKKYEAQRYMVVFSGHGPGINGSFLSKDDADKIESLSVISMARLVGKIASLIRRLRKKASGKTQTPREPEIDILGMDNCLMSMTEVAYMVHNFARVMIGAEGFEPMAGWPYRFILDSVRDLARKQPDGGTADDVKKLSKRIVCDYVKYYTDYQAAGVSVDQSACDLNQSVKLMWAVNSFAEVMLRYLPDSQNAEGFDMELRNALVMAHWEAQSYKAENYTDLYDFCERLKFYCASSNEKNAEVRSACQNVMNAIRGSDLEERPLEAHEKFRHKTGYMRKPTKKISNFREADGFVLKSCYSGPAVQYSFGVSIYFPWAEDPLTLTQYEQVYFGRDSGWVEFLKVYLQATKRAVRPGRSILENRLEASLDKLPDLGDKFWFNVINLTGSNSFLQPGHRHGSENKHGTENKHGSENKNLGNATGSMKNPPTRFDECVCTGDAASHRTTQRKALAEQAGAKTVEAAAPAKATATKKAPKIGKSSR